MAVWRAAKRAARAAMPPLAFLALAGYFGWNLTRGGRDLAAYAQRQQLLAEANTQLAQVQAKERRWETRISGLQPDHIDPDMLDERARLMLNLARPSDIIVPFTGSQRLF